MNDVFYRLKPGVPKQVLFFIAASFWGFASYRILHVAVGLLIHSGHSLWYAISGGVIGFVLFYRFVFYRVSNRYINRIRLLDIRRPCLFSFFDLRGYILMSIMITCGILFSRYVHLPVGYVAGFYLSLGLSLLVSAGQYIVAGIRSSIRARNVF